MSGAYYNECDPRAAQWLRELMADGLIPEGDVDERDIRDVSRDDLRAYRQCHFFAGVGGWAHALRLADWPYDRPVWTGSCPCQPFSVAGKGAGVDDPRHLWPAFRWLVAQCRPATVFGEQVASADGRDWLAGVRTDLEAMGYRVGAADLCAAGVGAPHLRQRLWWVADDGNAFRGEVGEHREDGCNRENGGRQEAHGEPRTRSEVCSTGPWSLSVWWPCRDGTWRRVPARAGHCRHADRAEQDGGIPDAERMGRAPTRIRLDEHAGRGAEEGRGVVVRYAGHDRLEAEPALFPLADGLPGRVGLLRGAGNAIVPQVAEQFIRAYREVIEEA